MKQYLKPLLVVFFLFFLSINQPAIAGWEWQNPLPQGNDLHAVWGNSETDIFAVGDYGTILHYDGSSWSEMCSEHSLSSIWGSSATNVFLL